MTHEISVPGENISFDCAEDETVLDSAERAGYAIPYSCRKGVCSSCEGTLKSGVAMVRGQGLCTGPMEGILLCQARPRSSLEILPKRIRRAEITTRKTFEAKVRKIARPSPDVIVLHLRFPIGKRGVFSAGQYLRVIMENGDSRNYSMANPPHRNDGVELHIKRVPGGKFSVQVLAGIDKGSVLSIELPYGEFSLSDKADSKALLIATGTGFAPLKSIIEGQIHAGGTRPLHLFWGVRKSSDLYMAELAEKWAADHDWFEYTPVVSQPDESWNGRTGYVHQTAQQLYPDMSGFEVYACGSPSMLADAKRDFCGHLGLAEDAFFSDAFVPSGDADEMKEPTAVLEGVSE